MWGDFGLGAFLGLQLGSMSVMAMLRQLRNRAVVWTGRFQGVVRMYRIILACNGVPAHVGAEAASDITEEFTHRPWHQNVRCEWATAVSKLCLLAVYPKNRPPDC
jgi:hypothetical protein